ncbi:alpha/beta hydrolase fold domain-containing protein [Nonomuraea sp. NPDC050663]|uniref:alpha/beta hydrolase fold domain-containing protein n=1 Tax=Nonomuraea sp. NPDC050663 TaxID=3364370 RepID=UPI0037BC6F3E
MDDRVTPLGDDSESGQVLSLSAAPGGLELRHLRSFVAVAEELNFGRAAQRLHLSQPALSRQIRALERLIGCDLFRRSTRQVELTLAGEALLDQSRSILAAVDGAISTARSIGHELTARAALLWEPMADATSRDDIESMRRAFEALHAKAEVPDGLPVRPVITGGVAGLEVGPASDARPHVLYVHGGGNIAGSAFGFRALAGAVALAASCPVLVPEYRLAPEHPFPAGLSDVITAYLWMLDEGVNPAHITLVGDSSGGALIVAAMVSLKQQNLAMPGGAVLLCPGLVHVPAGVDSEALARPYTADEIVVRARLADDYLAGRPQNDPLVDLVHADLSGLPPVLIQAATGDPAVVDAYALANRLRDHDVPVDLELFPVEAHVFHMFFSFLPEARDAIHHVGRRIRTTATMHKGSAADPGTSGVAQP